MRISIPNNIENADIYTRLSFKMHNEINDLTDEERQKIVQLLEDDYSSRLYSQLKAQQDEWLLQEASDKGVLL